MKKSVLFAIAGTVAMVSWSPLGAAAAGGVSAMSNTRTSDPAGDVPYCKGDLVSAVADWTNDVLRFQFETACGMDTNTDPSWTAGATGLGVAIDVDGDNEGDFFAVYNRVDRGVLYDASDAVACKGTASHPTGTSYVIELGTGCVPGPFTFDAVMVFDESPYDDTCVCPVDVAPDGAVAGPVTKGELPLHGQGYWMLGRDGAVYGFGSASVHGAPNLPGRAVDLEPTPSGRGYWIVNEAGAVQPHGDAASIGSVAAGALRPGEVVTAISRTASGSGYWLFTNLGGVFCFGDAPFLGSLWDVKLNGPVLDAIPTPSGNGYYMVGSDGGIFTFGDAVFQGSMGSVPLNAPVQSLVPDPDGVGYWLVASDGGIFAFEADFFGSMGSTKLNQPVTGMVGFGHGYLMVAEDGGIFTFGDAPFFGSLGANPPAVPIVSTAILNQ